MISGTNARESYINTYVYILIYKCVCAYVLKMPLRGVPVVRGLSISSDDCFLHHDIGREKERISCFNRMKPQSLRSTANTEPHMHIPALPEVLIHIPLHLHR